MEFSIDRFARPELIAGASVASYDLAPEVREWLNINASEPYRVSCKGGARYFHLWFQSERDATLFKTFFG